MIVLKENQRLYLRSCNYNMARMMSALANLVKEHGGRVKPTRQALISDRNCKDAEPIKVTHGYFVRGQRNTDYNWSLLAEFDNMDSAKEYIKSIRTDPVQQLVYGPDGYGIRI